MEWNRKLWNAQIVTVVFVHGGFTIELEDEALISLPRSIAYSFVLRLRYIIRCLTHHFFLLSFATALLPLSHPRNSKEPSCTRLLHATLPHTFSIKSSPRISDFLHLTISVNPSLNFSIYIFHFLYFTTIGLISIGSFAGYFLAPCDL